MSTPIIQTVELPTDEKAIHLRKPSKPNEQAQQINRLPDQQKLKQVQKNM